MTRCARGAWLAAFLAIAACGDSGPTAVADDDLVFRRADDSVISFGSATSVRCGPWEEDYVPVPTLHVQVGGVSAGWRLRAVVADIALGEQIAFPQSFVWDDPHQAHLFIYDPPNELSSAESGSSGYIVFDELSCGSGGRVRFHIDALVASEFSNLDGVRVTGSFASRLTD